MSEEINLDKLVPDDEEVFDSKLVEEVEQTETPPDFLSEQWHDYVMRQFMNDELDNGKPIRDGLVRVTEKLIGPIVDRQIVSFIAPHKDNYGTATVHIRLHIALTNESHPAWGIVDSIREDGIAEVNSRNTPSPFSLHQAASAASKAEAQACRKLLRLRKMIAADEATPEDMAMDADVYVPESPITDEQKTVIDILCKRINISVLDFISVGEIKYMFIEQVPSHKAQSMIKFLSEIQSAKKESPVKKVYDPAWREKNHKRTNNESTD